MTTRSPRPGETEGVDYLFRAQPEFDRVVSDGRMLEHARSSGSPTASRGARGSRSGVGCGSGVHHRLAGSPGVEGRAARRRDWMLSRATVGRRARASAPKDTDAAIRARMVHAYDELTHQADTEVAVLNINVDEAVKDVRLLLQASGVLALG